MKNVEKLKLKPIKLLNFKTCLGFSKVLSIALPAG